MHKIFHGIVCVRQAENIFLIVFLTKPPFEKAIWFVFQIKSLSQMTICYGQYFLKKIEEKQTA